MKQIRPGEYDKLITIEENTTGRDAVGGITNSWATHVTAWAKISPLQGFEAENNDQVKARLRYLMTIYWQAGIHPGMRVSWDSRYFDIESALERMEGQVVIMMNVTERDDST